jgi:hypothetical protein
MPSTNQHGPSAIGGDIQRSHLSYHNLHLIYEISIGHVMRFPVVDNSAIFHDALGRSHLATLTEEEVVEDIHGLVGNFGGCRCDVCMEMKVWIKNLEDTTSGGWMQGVRQSDYFAHAIAAAGIE